jgi:glycosyltransferase involved in cell wall biosynthesis
MIVRDEAAILPRCLGRLRELDLVDTWTVCDTGSADATRRVVREHLRDLPGRLYRHTWRDFGHNRTLALRRARGTARWLLVVDADFVVSAAEGLREFLAADVFPTLDAWHVLLHDHGLDYRLPLLVRGSADLRYVGVTHEYLDTLNVAPLLGLEIEHLGDGAATADKLERDLRLLAPGVEARDPRSTFYSAEALRFLGNYPAAVVLYARRAELNGWEEERWYARYMAAKLRGDIAGLWDAWQARPWRHEPLTAAAEIAAADPRAQLDSLFLEPVKGG